MRAIRVSNPVLDSYLTDIASDYSSGTSVTVKNNNSFAASDLAVFGKPGNELTELKKIDSISGSTGLTLASTLNFSHNKGTQVYKSLWDFVSMEGRSTSAGVFAELTQSGIQWDNPKNKTIYFHSAGTDTWQYRFRFYNSVTNTYSDYSPTLAGSGFTKYQMGYIINEARRVAGDIEGKVLTTDECLRVLTRGKNIIRAHNPKYWFWKVDGYKSGISISATAGDSVYDLTSVSNLGPINYIEYKYASGSTNEKWILKQKSDVEFLELTRDLNRTADDRPLIYRLLPPDSSSTEGYFEVENEIQNSGVGTFYISYYKEEDDYDGVDSTTSIIMPEILQDYLIAEIYASKGNDNKAERYYKLFTGPENREKTLALEKLSGIALLDLLDAQYKSSQGQPKSMWRYRGQRAVSRLFGSRGLRNTDQIREDYFDGVE